MGGFYFYIAVASLLLGVACRSFFVVSEEVLLFLLGVSLALGFVWARQQSWRALVVSVSLLFFSLGIIRFDILPELKMLPVNEDVQVVGEVRLDPEVRERNTHLYVGDTVIDDAYYGVKILAYVDSGYEVTYGDDIELTGKLQKPKSFETDLGRTFNYPGYLQARGVAYVMYYPDVQVIASDGGNFIFQKLFTFKTWFKHTVESVIPEPHVGLGEGLLLGEKSGLGETLEEVFRRTGIIHIVVLSGYNVMLVVVFVMAILAYVLGKQMRVLFGVVAIVLFAVMVGLSPTVVRASVMAVLILVAQATGQTYAVMRALFVAACLMVLWNPYLVVFDPGFQLSFLATFGLIVLAPKLEEKLAVIPAVIGLRSFLVATLATQIFVLPFLLYQIGEVSLVAIIVNVLVLPMVPVAMLLTFLTGLASLLSMHLATLVGWLAYLSLEYILVVANWFAAVPFAASALPPFHVGWMVFGYAVLGYIVWRLYVPQKAEMLAGWIIEDEGISSTESTFFRK